MSCSITFPDAVLCLHDMFVGSVDGGRELEVVLARSRLFFRHCFPELTADAERLADLALAGFVRSQRQEGQTAARGSDYADLLTEVAQSHGGANSVGGSELCTYLSERLFDGHFEQQLKRLMSVLNPTVLGVDFPCVIDTVVRGLTAVLIAHLDRFHDAAADVIAHVIDLAILRFGNACRFGLVERTKCVEELVTALKAVAAEDASTQSEFERRAIDALEEWEQEAFESVVFDRMTLAIEAGDLECVKVLTCGLDLVARGVTEMVAATIAKEADMSSERVLECFYKWWWNDP